eukprot:jgi/Botrbrau1/16365/Bobra.0372s0004.1
MALDVPCLDMASEFSQIISSLSAPNPFIYSDTTHDVSPCRFLVLCQAWNWKTQNWNSEGAPRSQRRSCVDLESQNYCNHSVSDKYQRHRGCNLTNPHLVKKTYVSTIPHSSRRHPTFCVLAPLLYFLLLLK